MTEELYCDGGVIGRNPSKIGGTWAWTLVRDGYCITTRSDILRPKDIDVDKITNNQAELYAAMRALQYVPKDWAGTLFTDSRITLLRLTVSDSFKGIPNEMRKVVLELRRGRKYKVILLAGHPTKKELKAGRAGRNGNPVSEWNVWCDEECQRLAKEYQA